LSDVRSTIERLPVPKPITGSFSPDEGIARVSIADDSAFACARDARTGKHNPAALTPIKRVASVESFGSPLPCHFERSRLQKP